MTDDRPNTPGEQSEPVMDGAMDHEGPPTTTDRAGNDVDLSPLDDEQGANQGETILPWEGDTSAGPEDGSARGSEDHTVDAEHPDELDVADETVWVDPDLEK